MPFVMNPLDEEEKKKQETEQGGPAPAMTSGGETFGGGSFAAGNTGEKGSQGKGSGFVGLDQYMQANKGNNFGGQFTGKVQDTVNTAKQDLQTGANEFTNASNQGAVKWNDVGDQAKGIVDNAGDGMSQDDVSKFQGWSNAKYQGPETFTGSAFGTKAQGSVQKAAQQGKALQSEGGRFALLDQFYGRPKYSMGEKTLDNLLVQNAPGVGARAQAIGGQAKKLTSEGQATEQNMNNLVSQNRQATADTSRQSKDYLGNAIGGFKSDLTSRFDDAKNQGDAFAQARRDDLSDDAFDTDTMGLLGIEDGATLYDVDLSNYLRDNPQGSLGQFASDEDYARYLALQQLAGDDPSFLSPSDRDQAGSAKFGIDADRERLAQDLSARGTAYNQARNQGSAERQATIGAYQDEFENHLGTLGPHHPMTQHAAQKLQGAQQEMQEWLANLDAQYGANRKASRAGGTQ